MPIPRAMNRLSSEHERLDDLLSDVGVLLRAGRQRTARRHLTRFTSRFDHYVRTEERLLFAALESAGSGAPGAPTGPMRREHRSLRRLVAALFEAIEGGDRKRALEALASLRSVLLVHHAKEEWLIHPHLAAVELG
jgi:hemerythrin-like domain-containing protein